MSDLPHEGVLDDRAQDENVDRLRDAAAHLIDVVRRCVRAELDAGTHPVDAVIQGTGMLESWHVGMTLDAAASPDAYSLQVQELLTRLHERVGAQRMWDWLCEPNQALRGMTPLRALVGHGLRNVTRLIDAMSPAQEPETQTDIAGDVAPVGPGGSFAAFGLPVPQLTAHDYQTLERRGLLSERLALRDGRVVLGRDASTGAAYDVVFAPAQARAAAALGIRVYSAVDAVLGDTEAVRELLFRLATRIDETTGPQEQSSSAEDVQ